MGNRKRLLWLAPLLVVAVLALAFGIYVSDYYRASDEALAVLNGSETVSVEDAGSVIALDGPGTEAGLIFYPGAKVQAEAYLPLLEALAERGVDCYLVKMPFNLAVLGINRASKVMAAREHQRWYLAGHSMGGAMAATWAAEHPGALDGLVLLAAYSPQPLPEALEVLVLYGSEDGVLNRGRLESSADNLPQSAVVEELPGGNHAGFGSYGTQRGDGEATVTPQEQQRLTVEKICRWMDL